MTNWKSLVWRACGILALGLCSLGCGAESAEPPEAPEAPAQPAAQAESVIPEAEDTPPSSADLEAPPLPTEGPLPLPPAVPGDPLTVEMVEVVAGEQTDEPDPLRAQLEAESGLLRVRLSGYSAHCDPTPRLLARLDGTVVRVYGAPNAVQALCVRPYAITALIDGLPGGTYTVEVGRPGQGTPESVGEVQLEGPAETPPPGDAYAVVQRSETAGAGQQLGVQSASSVRGITEVQMSAAPPCGVNALFGAHRDGDRLILRLRGGPFAVARCASLVKSYRLEVETGDFVPTSTVLQNYLGEDVTVEQSDR